MNIPEGFTKWDFNIHWNSYEGFAWSGELLVELDGQTKIVHAMGIPSGDSGNFTFKFDLHDFTQQQVNRLNILAFKTENPTPFS